MRRSLVAVLLLLLTLTASADVRKDTQAGISYDIPSLWQREPGEDGVYTIGSEDETVVVSLWTLQRGVSLQDALALLEVRLAKLISGAQAGEATEGSLNGMRTVSVTGKGKMSGKRVEYSVIVLEAKAPVIIMAFVQTGKYEKHSEELRGFLSSIKRIK